MDLQRAVATRINNLLIKHGITRYRLCKNIAMSEQTVKNIIDETTKDIKLTTVANIADGFGMTISEFFDDPLFAKENLDLD